MKFAITINPAIAVLIIALLSFQIFITFQNIQLRNDRSTALSKSKKVYEQLQYQKRKFEELHFCYWSKDQRKIIASNNVGLINSMDNGKKVICYVTENMCRSCILQVLQDLNILGNRIGTRKIALLLDKNFEKEQLNIDSYPFEVLLADSLYLSIQDNITVPFIFVLNKDLDIILPYSTDSSSKLYQEYFNKILPSYFGD
jgi:predicted RND superfamily exporter protein